jgi:hypothetical protein
MLTKPLAGLIVAASFCSFAATAAPVIIDFEEFTDGALDGTTLATKGMIFDWAGLSPSLPAIGSEGWTQGAGFHELGFCGFCEDTNGTALYTANGTSFELDSFRFGGNPESSDLFFNGTVTGYIEGGGTVSQFISVGPEAPQLISFDSSWTNLTSVEIIIDVLVDGHLAFDIFVIDDVHIQAVPAPAAVWLFGSALAGLGWMRRKQSV